MIQYRVYDTPIPHSLLEKALTYFAGKQWETVSINIIGSAELKSNNLVDLNGVGRVEPAYMVLLKKENASAEEGPPNLDEMERQG